MTPSEKAFKAATGIPKYEFTAGHNNESYMFDGWEECWKNEVEPLLELVGRHQSDTVDSAVINYFMEVKKL